MKVAGLMCGSSLDAVDICVVKFDNCSRDSKIDLCEWHILETRSFELEDELIYRLRDARNMDAFNCAKLDVELGVFFASCLSSMQTRFDAAGVHGTTVFHLPEFELSKQLGHGAQIAAKLKCPVVTDFRSLDLALGGVGTPMALIADRYLFSGYDACLNLGGICNISDGIARAYDVCPFNQVLNHFAAAMECSYDDKGSMAKAGKVDFKLLQKLDRWGYYQKSIPKSLDNAEVVCDFLTLIPERISSYDVLASCTEHFALKISLAIRSLGADSVLITGGGAYNEYFIERLQANLLHGVETIIPPAEIIEYKEAILISLAAKLRLQDYSNFSSLATGAIRDSIGGCVYNGRE